MQEIPENKVTVGGVAGHLSGDGLEHLAIRGALGDKGVGGAAIGGNRAVVVFGNIEWPVLILERMGELMGENDLVDAGNILKLVLGGAFRGVRVADGERDGHLLGFGVVKAGECLGEEL